MTSFNDFPVDKFVKSLLVLVLMKRDNVFNEARACATLTKGNNESNTVQKQKA